MPAGQEAAQKGRAHILRDIRFAWLVALSGAVSFVLAASAQVNVTSTPTLNPPPVTVTLNAPVAGTMLSGPTNALLATTSQPVSKLEFDFLRGGQLAASFPYAASAAASSWPGNADVSPMVSDNYDVMAVAYDSAGNVLASSAAATVTVQNQMAIRPQVALVLPVANFISDNGLVSLAATAGGVDHVIFRIDSQSTSGNLPLTVATVENTAYDSQALQWSGTTASLPDGPYSVTAIGVYTDSTAKSAMILAAPVMFSVARPLPSITWVTPQPSSTTAVSVTVDTDIALVAASTLSIANATASFDIKTLSTTAAGNVGQLGALSCVIGSQCLQWRQNWHPTAVGDYAVTARVQYPGMALASSATLNFHVVAPSPSPPPFSVKMNSLGASSVLAGSLVTLGAVTSATADRLEFELRSAGGVVSPLAAAPLNAPSNTSWSASWTAPNADTYQIWPQAWPSVPAGLTAVPTTDAALTLTVQPSTTAAPKVTLVAPHANQAATVDLALQLYATSDQNSPQSVGFSVRALFSSAVYDIPGTCADQVCRVWSASWTPPAAGQYSIVARVRPVGFTADTVSANVGISVAAAASAPANTAPKFNVHLTGPLSNPPAGSTAVTLSAVTNATADYLDFVLRPSAPGASAITVHSVAADSLRRSWSVVWTAPTSDTYKLSASSAYLGAPSTFQATSDNILSFTVLPLAPAPAVPPAHPKVVLIGPDAGFVPTANAVVRLYASSDLAKPEATGFLVYLPGSTDGQKITPVACVTGTDCRYWTADWMPQTAGEYGIAAFTRVTGATTDILSEKRVLLVSEPATAALTVTVLYPGDGATLSARTVNLTARTSVAAAKLGFVIRPQTPGAAAYPGLPAAPDTAGTGWSATWQAPANGTYEAVAEALPIAGATITTSAVAVRSPAVTFSVASATLPTSDTAKPPSALIASAALLSPSRGASAVAGRPVSLVATVDPDEAQLQFVIKALDGTVRTVDSACSVSEGCGVREAKWTPPAPGNYAVFVRAKFPGEATARDFPSVNLMVGDASLALPAPATPASADLTVKPPASDEPVAIGVLQPTVPQISGPLAVSFRTSGPVKSVKWSVYPSGGNQPLFTRLAVRLPDGTWAGFWNTKDVPNGRYQLVGLVADPASEAPASARRELTVQNEVLAVQIPPAAGTVQPSAEAMPPSTPTPIVEPIMIIPPAVVRAAVSELPRGAEALPTAEVKLSSMDATTDARCLAARIPAAKCREWLDYKLTPQRCRDAGIVVREECVAYLQSQPAETPAQDPCAGKTREQCLQTLDGLTGGMAAASSMRQTQTAVADAVGTVFTMAASGAPTPPVTAMATADLAPPTVAAQVAKLVPLVSPDSLTVRVLASTEYAKTEEGNAVSQVPGIVVVDSDGDGLPDDLERRIGTDPHKRDTDNDGYDDFTELKNGYDPLTPGGNSGRRFEIAPIDRAVISGVPLEQPRTSGQIHDELKVTDVSAAPASTDGAGPRTKLAGRALPGQVVTIYVYSYLPVVLTTQADADGNWSYDLASGMSEGKHEAYVTVTDESGTIQAKSEPLAFMINQAQAQTPRDYYDSLPLAETAIQTPVNRMVGWYLVGAVLAILLGLGIGGVLVYSRLKRE